MIVPLIPLFLGAIIGVKENDWKYGSEAIYDVRVDSVSYTLGEMEKVATFNMSMKLNCRPKSDASLICHFNESNVAIVSTKNMEKFETQGESFTDETFELKFNEAGLCEIVVSSTINLARLDMIRAIVSQLSIGAYFYDVPKFDLEIVENFTTGTCETRYALSSNDAIKNDERPPYQIIKIPDMITTMGDVKEFTRVRNLDKCHHRVDYFFGSREAQRSTPSNIKIKLKSSKSHMIMRESNLTSWTENEIIVSSKLDSSGNRLVERITLNLENIVEASGPLPTINDSSTASIFPGRWLHDDSSEENISSEEIISSEETNDFN